MYNSIAHAVFDIYEKEGVSGFYRGLGPSITQIMPYMGLMFFSYEGLCSIFQVLKVKELFHLLKRNFNISNVFFLIFWG